MVLSVGQTGIPRLTEGQASPVTERWGAVAFPTGRMETRRPQKASHWGMWRWGRVALRVGLMGKLRPEKARQPCLGGLQHKALYAGGNQGSATVQARRARLVAGALEGPAAGATRGRAAATSGAALGAPAASPAATPRTVKELGGAGRALHGTRPETGRQQLGGGGGGERGAERKGDIVARSPRTQGRWGAVRAATQ